jgi:hypothetical protein
MGVTVVFASDDTEKQYVVTTKEAGHFEAALPPGSYSVLVLYGDVQLKRHSFEVYEKENTPFAASLDLSRLGGETIAVTYTSASHRGGMRSKAADWMVMPNGVTTIEGSFGFVTARGKQGEGGLAFSDVVLATLGLSRAFGERLELSGGATFLPKQPSFTNDSAWQGSTLAARVGFGKRYALDLAASGGRIVSKKGYWAQGGASVSARKSLDETLVLEGAVGGNYTSLFEDDRAKASWLAEVGIRGQITFRVPNGMAAAWLATAYYAPIAEDSIASMDGAAPYNAQTRVNAQIGGVLSYIRNWDIWTTYTVIDRGDFIDPTTTQPILVGGSDQRQFLVGLTHHLRH